MKKITLLSLSILLTSFTAVSQIIIHSGEILGVGDEVIQGFDNSPDQAIEPGPEGEDLNWDFGSLFADEIDTFRFVNPLSTPYWMRFPGSNVCLLTLADSNFVYFDKDTDNLTMKGLVVEAPGLGKVSSPVHPGEEFLSFPCEYGFQDNESFYYLFLAEGNTPGVDSLRVKRTTDKSLEVDAWGSMSTPIGTYDVLRIHELREVTDSIWGKVPFFGWQFIDEEQSTEERYIWWSDDPAVGYILANLNIDPSNGDVLSAEFMAEPNAPALSRHVKAVEPHIYPNPVRDLLHVEIVGAKYIQLHVYDLSGRLLLQKRLSGATGEISVEYLDKGLYLLEYNISGQKGRKKILVR